MATQEEAIRLAGKALVDAGYVTADYIEKMLEREGLTSTYMGNAIAIPHGTEDSKQDVLHSGISVIQLLPSARHISVENFLNSPKYDELINQLKK
ncbi:hypothetical protein DT075_34925 [Bacillus licheniformis]|nr:hypothetical protein DT075_34925 [Bacillus licheniformis]